MIIQLDYIVFIWWFCANHGKGVVRISNLLGLFVNSLLPMFSENSVGEDEKLMHSDSEREDLEWAKKLDYSFSFSSVIEFWWHDEKH